MEDFYTNTSTYKSYNYSNISINNDDNTVPHSTYYKSILNVVEWIIVCSGLPLTLLAIAAVYSLVRKDHVAPIYIINLLVSDLLQLCCLAAEKAGSSSLTVLCFYFFGLMVSVGFMVCISLERYFIITQPLWYRFRRKIKISLAVCVVAWILPLVYILPFYFDADIEITETIFAVYLLLPFPLFIFCLIGTIKAMSAVRSVPADEKRRIVAILVVVLLIYTVLFLPNIIWLFAEEARNHDIYFTTSFLLLNISPIADLSMYFFIRKGAIDKLLASLCSMSSNEQSSSMGIDMSVKTSQTL